MKTPNSLCQIGSIQYCVKFVCTLILLISFNSSSQTPAFPSVEGGGTYTTGGRGGIVVKVTNLNNSGPGSLREALLMTVPRIIVFEVSGTITLTSSIELIAENSNFTVAGQTAPEGGITISNHLIQLGGGYNRPAQPCNNVIWRYVRFRNGRYNGQPDVREHNGLISYGTDGLVIDHCSFSFCDDQALGMSGNWGDLTNITVQRSVFSENATGIIAGHNTPNDQGLMTFKNNLYVDQSHRTPNVSGNLQYDLINNVYFNWQSRLTTSNVNSPNINFIGNYLRPGNYTLNGSANKVQNVSPNIYTANNYHPEHYPVPQLNDQDLWQSFVTNGSLPSNIFTTNMHPLIESPTVISAQDTYNEVLNNVGANKFLNADGTFGTFQDSFDILKINNVINNISSDPFNKNWTLPTLPNNTRPANYDTDNDGMADLWEINTFGDLSRTSNGDEDNDGYTNIEEFLNGTDAGSITVFQVSASDDTSICDGETTTLTASGADSYVWTPGNLNGASIDVNPTSNTTYTVTGSHSDGSTSTDDIVVTVNPIPVADAGEDTETCHGTAVTLTANGGSSFLWNTGATTQSISVNPNATTTYSVQVSENDCLSPPDEVTVTVNPLPNVDAGADVTINYGESTELFATGADSYVWSTGETTQSITVNPTVDETYTVTGTTGTCQNSDSVTVFIIGSEVVANAGEDQTICNGSQTTLTATGGAAYVWNTGATTASINVSPSTTTNYTVTAYDSTGTVSDDDDVTVFVNELPIIEAGADVTITEGESTTLSASGADSYEWNTGATSQSINVNPTTTTTYSVIGVVNGCESTDSVTVFVETETVVANAGADQTICEGETVTLTASGGSSYQWNTGATTASIDVTPNTTTTYTVTVFNTLGTSSDTDDVIVNVNTLPNVDAGADVIIEEGESVNLTASGADSYVWNTGATTQNIEVNPSSTTTYSVTGFLNGCESTDEVTVTVETETVIAYAGADQSICEGETVTLTATGGSSYQWNTGATTASIDVTPNTTTTYTVTVFNTLGTNSDTDDVTVNVDALPNVDAGMDTIITEGETITLIASGADAYVWNTGATTQSIDVNPSSTTTYSVTGISNGCESSDEVTVTVETETVIANAGADESICQGETVTLIASGGSTYQWNTGATTPNIEVSPNTTTTYTVTVFNTLGTDSDTDEVTVNVNALPNVDAGMDAVITEGENTTLTASGADSYIWNTGATTQSIEVNPTSTTTYSVTGFLNGCESTDEVTVTVETETVVANAGADQTICEGETVTLTATGGSTYQWNTGATTASINVNPNTTSTYIVTVFNTLGTSSDTDDVTVNVNALPNVDAGANVTITEGQSTTLTVSGADSYIWSTGATISSIEVSPATTTTYSVTGFLNGCESSDEITVIVEPIVFTADAGENQFICEGTSTTLTASQGDAYLWSTGETTQSIEVSPWATETYTVTVFEGDEQAEDDVTVFVNLNPNVVIMNGGEVTILEGEFITLSASGANSYEWNNGATQPNIAVSPANSTVYSVTGYINNCSDNKSITVNVVEAVVANAGEDQFICENETVTLTANGGDEYLWNTGETTQSIQVAPESDTEYSVLVYNDLSFDEDAVMVFVNDCSEEETPQVEQEFNFLVYQDAQADVLKVQISGMDRVDVDQIVIYDLTGKIIYSEQLKAIANTQSLDKEIDSSQLARGIYIVRLMYDDTEILKKIPIR